MELFEVFYLIKRGEKRTTKRKDRVRVPKMEGKRGRKRKNIRTVVFFRVSASRKRGK